MLGIINQVFEIEQKTAAQNNTLLRNFERLYHEFEELGYKIVNPAGQPYDVRDASVEATIIEHKETSMFVAKVIKPAVYKTEGGIYQLIQKSVVIVE